MGEGRCVFSAPRGVQTGDCLLLDQFGRPYALEGKNRNSPAGDTYWKLASVRPIRAMRLSMRARQYRILERRHVRRKVQEVTAVWRPSSSPRRTQLLA